MKDKKPKKEIPLTRSPSAEEAFVRSYFSNDEEPSQSKPVKKMGKVIGLVFGKRG